MRTGAVPCLVALLLLPGPEASSQPAPKHWGGPRFAGKAIIVTGGDSGIGLAAVKAFFFECGSVMMVGHSEAKTWEAWSNVSSLKPPAGCPTPPKLVWAALDISNASAVRQLVQQTVELLGGMDVAVNNAGVLGADLQIGDPGFVDYFAHSPEMQVNVQGTLNCMNAELQYWNSTHIPGVMVNVASILGEVGWLQAAYTTSKWAMIGFSKQASMQYARSGIRVNVLAPGPVDTPMLRRGRATDDPEWLREKVFWSAPVPVGRIAEPWEMAGPITFLASDMSSYLYGHVLTADGGLMDANPYVADPSPQRAACEAPPLRDIFG